MIPKWYTNLETNAWVMLGSEYGAMDVDIMWGGLQVMHSPQLSNSMAARDLSKNL